MSQRPISLADRMGFRLSAIDRTAAAVESCARDPKLAGMIAEHALRLRAEVAAFQADLRFLMAAAQSAVSSGPTMEVQS